MRRLYFRWIGIFMVGGVIAFLGARRYCSEVAALSVEATAALTEATAVGEVRVLGQVVAGSLTREGERLKFRLAGATQQISVDSIGADRDAIRALKTLVIIGRWTPSTQTFTADGNAPIPNYGYITAAYLIGLIPLALFLLYMERTVRSLYAAIKQEKVYEPEHV